MPFDLAAPGNQELDFGPENFAQKLAGSKYPRAAINITNAGGSAVAGLGGVMFKEIAGIKIALVPVAQDTAPQVQSPGDLKFLPIVQIALDATRQARAHGADVPVHRSGQCRTGTMLTRRDSLTGLPFGNETVLIGLLGSQNLAALENGFSQVEKGAGRFPQVSG